MKRIKRYGFCIYISQLVMVSAVSAAWWGILYPEFGFTADTFAAVEQEKEQDDGIKTKHTLSGTEAFFEMLDAEPGQIKIKSKIFEEVFGIRGNEDEQRSTDWNF